MRIHTDILRGADIYAAVPAGCDLESTRHGSRSRNHAFEVSILAYGVGDAGTDAYGQKRTHHPNTGRYGGDPNIYAGTWQDWGDFFAALFAVDPRAIIGPYDGVADFVQQTIREAPRRYYGKDAAGVAARAWRRRLYREVPSAFGDAVTDEVALDILARTAREGSAADLAESVYSLLDRTGREVAG